MSSWYFDDFQFPIFQSRLMHELLCSEGNPKKNIMYIENKIYGLVIKIKTEGYN